MTLQQRIKRKREKRGWTQSELARRVGVSRVMIHYIETGKRYPSNELAGCLARVLGNSWKSYAKLPATMKGAAK